MASHRDLIAWQVSHALAVAVQRYSARNWQPKHSAILDQLRRSALSVPLNLAEGYAFGPCPRCTNHFRVAYGSAVETVAVLEIMRDAEDARDPAIESLLVHANRSSALVYGLIRHRTTHPRREPK